MGARVRFHHPLVRSAVYGAASPHDRHQVHRALAEATDPAVDPDRRAWHRAQATAGTDEDVAAELESSAGRAQARGGFAAAAAFLERDTVLTPDPGWRGARALAAAQAKFDAAAPDRAYELLAIADMAPMDELQRARIDVLRAQISFARGGSDAAALMLAAAERLEPLDAGLAREAYLEAFGATLFAGRLSGAVGVREVADAARAAARAGSSSQPPRALDLLLDGLVARFTEGYAAGVAPLRRALEELQALLRDAGLVGREVRFAWGVSPELLDDEAWHELDWAIGIDARSRALLSDGQTAEQLYQDAIERLARSRIAVHLARAHLLLGEWLRRERRRTDARTQLRIAHEMFVTMGRGVRRARRARATGHGRDHSQTWRRDERPAHGPGGPGGQAGPRRPLECSDRRAVVH